MNESEIGSKPGHVDLLCNLGVNALQVRSAKLLWHPSNQGDP